MADTKPPKNNKTDAPDIGRRDGSSYYGTMSQECSDFFYAFRDKAIAADKRKRLIKATLDALNSKLPMGRSGQIKSLRPKC